MSSLKAKADDATTPEAREKYLNVMQRAQDMSESIKHAIVLLQIAKNATVPQEATALKDFTKVADKKEEPKTQDMKEQEKEAVDSSSVPAIVMKQATIIKPDKTSAIPEISYSSSDEDDFYDCDDDDDVSDVEAEKEKEGTSPVSVNSALISLRLF